MTKYAAVGDILPYTDRKLRHANPVRWSTEEIVKAQCMACQGATVDDIAQALGREMSEVIKVVEQEPVQSKAKTRQAVAGVGHTKAKERW